ncbi:MAG: carboxylating nicotinate-nucleotide diphosphorylase [Planctomycetota bacterium]|nr:MAG: carboxylating nicotinate-nucleotide diphosphorylase [Planctomycetota bacterium]
MASSASPHNDSAAVASLPPFIVSQLRAALAEDLGQAGDVTTALALGGRGPIAGARIVAKQAGRLSGVELAVAVFALVDPQVVVTVERGDGAAVEPGDLVLSARGPAASLLEAERTALNVLCRLSGVASLVAQFVREVSGTRAAVVDTRKTTPGWRLAEKAAVLHGGGVNHRIGLYDEVLIKENHFAFSGAGGYRELLEQVRAGAPQGMRITAEARDLDEARAVADGGADVILLDNFGVEGLTHAVEVLAEHPRRAQFLLEASGGVSLQTVAAVASSGVDRISVGALTHSAPALDLSLLIEPEGAA